MLYRQVHAREALPAVETEGLRANTP